MRISMQILADRLRQNYPEISAGEMAEEMNLKRPLLYQSGMEFKKNKVYVARESDVTAQLLRRHGDNVVLVVGMSYCPEENRMSGVCFFPDTILPEALFNTVQRIFDTYDAWDEKLQSLAMSERTLKMLLDGSHRIFHNPIMVYTLDGFLIDYSSLMDMMPELQEILRHNQVTSFPGEGVGDAPHVQYFLDPDTRKNNLFVDICDMNRQVYRIIVVEASRKLKVYDEYLLLHLAKYIHQMLEKYTVVQSDISYTLDRLLSNILTDESMERTALESRFESFHWKQEHTYFCMSIYMSMVDRQNLTVIRFICNRIESAIKGSCAFFLEGNIVVYTNLTHFGGTIEEAVKKITEFMRSSYLKGGVSYEFEGLECLRRYYLQAKVAMEEGMKLHPLKWVNRFEDIALDYLMKKCTEDLGMETVCSRAVLDLRRYDEDHKTEYFETLRVYLYNQMNAVKAAKALFIHRSTFLYRMNHIRELISLDLENPDQLLYLLLTYKLLERPVK